MPTRSPRALPAVVAAFALACTCAAQDGPTAEEQVEVARAAAEWKAEAMRKARMADLQASGLCRAQSRFGLELLQQLVAADPAGNHLVAPLGVFTLLNLLAEGADAAAREKLAAALHVQALDRPSLQRALGTLRESLASREFAQIGVSCSLWLGKDFAAAPDFLAVARDGYDARVADLDFSGEGAAQAIDDWVSGSTHGAIPAVVTEVGPDTPLLALTVTSFRSEWLHRFDEDGTRPHAITDETGLASEVPMMHVFHDFAYAHDTSLGAQLVRLPTLAVPEEPESWVSCSLYVILPDAGQTVSGVLDRLVSEPLSWRFSTRLAAEASETTGHVHLPRFRFSNRLQLRGVLGRMGLQDALHGASLSGISHALPDLLLQQANMIDVDESGVSAASADLATPFGSPGEGPPFSFVADHPFLYVLFDDATGALLYAGVLARPE